MSMVEVTHLALADLPRHLNFYVTSKNLKIITILTIKGKECIPSCLILLISSFTSPSIPRFRVLPVLVPGVGTVVDGAALECAWGKERRRTGLGLDNRLKHEIRSIERISCFNTNTSVNDKAVSRQTGFTIYMHISMHRLSPRLNRRSNLLKIIYLVHLFTAA